MLNLSQLQHISFKHYGEKYFFIKNLMKMITEGLVMKKAENSHLHLVYFTLSIYELINPQCQNDSFIMFMILAELIKRNE